MAGYKEHPPLGPRLIGYDPVVDLPPDHLAYLVDMVVDMAVLPPPKPYGPGQPERDPRVALKVLLYSALTGVHSSRRMAQNCRESLPYLLLVRDDRPCHTVLAQARRRESAHLKLLMRRLGEFAVKLGMPCLGRIAIDSSKFAAHASSDSIVEAVDLEKTISAFEAILASMEEVDVREDVEGPSVRTSTGVSGDQMRDILRSIGKERDHDYELSPRMVKRVKSGLETLKTAKSEGVSHVSLTDPDARMMKVGSKKNLGMGHLLEAVADNGNLVVGLTGNHASDGGRLLPLFELAKAAVPVPVTHVAADTGYFNGGQVMDLLKSGLELVVPDRAAALEMRQGQIDPADAPLEFEKVEGKNAYRCPEGNILKLHQHYQRDGQRFTKYIASRECTGCPLAKRCLQQKNTKRRHLTVGEFRTELKALAEKFRDPEIRKAYNARGPAIETVFAVIRNGFGFHRWHVIGKSAVESEGALISCAYQLKKIQMHLAKTGKSITGATA